MQETQVQAMVRKIPWRRQRLLTPVFLPGQRNLEGYNSWGHEELDMTEQLTLSLLSGRHCCSMVDLAKKKKRISRVYYILVEFFPFDHGGQSSHSAEPHI